jgi:hypothetical protein
MAVEAPLDDSMDEVLGKDLKQPIYAVQRAQYKSDFLI